MKVFVALYLSTSCIAKVQERERVFDKKIERTLVSGNITDNPNCNSLLECGRDCVATKDCIAILFNPNYPESERCKHIVCENNLVNLTDWKDFDLYSVASDTVDLGIGVQTPIGWTSGKPKLYFALDLDTRHGINSSNIDFVDDSIVGKALSNPSTTSTVSL